MKNETNLFKRIRNIIVGNTLPKNEDLWIDTSNGEKNAVLKYKGNPLVGGGSGSESGCDCGIPTIDKNTQLNLVQRDATDEDKAKFITSPIISVVDIQDGKLPLFMIGSHPIDPEDPSAGSTIFGMPLINVTFPTENDDGSVRYGDKSTVILFYISRDWSLLGVQGIV